jgi:hypothetical protein
MSDTWRFHSVLPLLLLAPAHIGDATARVHGAVLMMSDTPEGIKGVKLSFVTSNGTVVETTTNNKGEYQVLLKAELEYNVTVVSGPACELHRPQFRPASGSTIRFDFVVPSEITYVDWDIHGSVPSGTKITRPTVKVPYCDEETMSFGNPPHDLIISYGIFRSKPESDIFDSLPMTRFPGKYLPVTISYQTSTIRADEVEFVRKNKELTATGNVSIADGSSSEPMLASCVTIQLGDTTPYARRCERGYSK